MDVDYDDEVAEEGARPAGRRVKGRGGEEDDRYAGKAGKFERLDDDDDETGAARSIEGWVVIVSGVHEEAQEDDIFEAFSEYGDIKNLHLNLDRRTGFVKGYAFIEYENKQEEEGPPINELVERMGSCGKAYGRLVAHAGQAQVKEFLWEPGGGVNGLSIAVPRVPQKAVTTELETRFRKMISEERASRFQENAVLQEHLGRVEENFTAERNTQAKKMEGISSLVDKVTKDLETEKDAMQVQMRELLNRQDTLRSSLVDGTREIREIEDDQTRLSACVLLPPACEVAALTERMDQEIMMRQGMLEIRQQLHNEDSCNHILGRLDGETKTRLEAFDASMGTVDRNNQLAGDLEMRHDLGVSRGEAMAALEERTAALQQDCRDVIQSISQLKEMIFSETNAKFEEVDAAFKNVQQTAGADQQGRLQAAQHLEAMISKSNSDMGQERSLREEQFAMTGGRLSQIDAELEDVRLNLRDALQRCEELRLAHDAASHMQAERHAEATGAEISMKELKARMEHLQQVTDSRDRTTTQKLTELLAAIENEAKERAAGDDDVLRRQSSAKEALPAMLTAERHRTDAALAKLEEVLRQEDVAERQHRNQALNALEVRWQQLREATEESLKHRLEQQSNVAMEVAKVSEALLEEQRTRQQEQKALTNELQRLGQEVSDAGSSRRATEE
ncbi:Y14A, partial [Symbiodinium pilosum]